MWEECYVSVLMVFPNMNDMELFIFIQILMCELKAECVYTIKHKCVL